MILTFSVSHFVFSRFINNLTMANSNIFVFPLPVGALTTICFSKSVENKGITVENERDRTDNCFESFLIVNWHGLWAWNWFTYSFVLYRWTLQIARDWIALFRKILGDICLEYRLMSWLKSFFPEILINFFLMSRTTPRCQHSLWHLLSNQNHFLIGLPNEWKW